MRKLAILLTLALFAVWAQTERGNITGAVTDSSGAAVPGAIVIITHTSTNQSVTVTSTSAGDYNGANLPPGDYRLEFSATGFKKTVLDHVVLTAASTVRVDGRLEIGQVSETVEVRADAAKVQTENAKISTAVQNKMVDELPLVVGGAMRNPYSLITITPESKGNGNHISLGGGQAAAWDATLDGVSATTNRSADAGEINYNAPSMEAITEFTIDTNGFKAEYGNAGGGVITFVSKSGKTSS